jgi:hypothetical protein
MAFLPVAFLLLPQEKQEECPVKRIRFLGVISALLVGLERISKLRRPKPSGARAAKIVTLREVLNHQVVLPTTAMEFYEALLSQGEVLAVRVDYLPEPLLWLTTTSEQARWMREQHNGHGGLECVVMSAADAHDLLTATRTEAPATLYEIAQVLISQAPDEIPSPDDPS